MTFLPSLSPNIGCAAAHPAHLLPLTLFKQLPKITKKDVLRIFKILFAGLAFAKTRYFASVLENSTKSDQVLVIVTVLGADLNENLRFSILNLDEESRGLFSIGETSGALKTTGKMNSHPYFDSKPSLLTII